MGIQYYLDVSFRTSEDQLLCSQMGWVASNVLPALSNKFTSQEYSCYKSEWEQVSTWHQNRDVYSQYPVTLCMTQHVLFQICKFGTGNRTFFHIECWELKLYFTLYASILLLGEPWNSTFAAGISGLVGRGVHMLVVA